MFTHTLNPKIIHLFIQQDSINMAPENNNWLSFSLSSMEMLNSSHQSSSMLQSNTPSAVPHESHQYFFADNFFPHGKYAL